MAALLVGPSLALIPMLRPVWDSYGTLSRLARGLLTAEKKQEAIDNENKKALLVIVIAEIKTNDDAA